MKTFEQLNIKHIAVYHGLGSTPSPDRDQILRKIGYSLISEHHDYQKEWELDKGKSLFERELQKVKNCELILGISFGGYLAYLLSKATGIPCILINPAIDRDKSKSVIKHFDIEFIDHDSKIEVFCGENDIAVNPTFSLEFLNKHENDFTYTIIPNQAHRVPCSFFKEVLKKSQFINYKNSTTI